MAIAEDDGDGDGDDPQRQDRPHGDEVEHELERIFVAARLAEAQRVEEVLALQGVEYVVEVEPFVAGIFSTFRPRNGAVFYVRSSQAPFCRARLLEAGLGRGLIDEQDE